MALRLKSILISVAIVMRTCCVASLMSAALKQYNEDTQGKRGHGMGPEHWAFKALLKALLGYFKVVRVMELDLLDATIAFRRRVMHCRVIVACADFSSRLEWSVCEDLIWLYEFSVQSIAELPAAELKQGRAPSFYGGRLVCEGSTALSKRLVQPKMLRSGARPGLAASRPRPRPQRSAGRSRPLARRLDDP